MNPGTLDYLSGLPRDRGAAETLRALCAVLRDFGDSEQLHSLAVQTGRTLARQRPLGECRDLQSFAQAADEQFRAAGWGTLQAATDGAAVDFRHDAAPLAAWFGADHGDWCYGLFEGVLAEWLETMGADEALEIQRVAEASEDDAGLTARYRFAHRAKLRAASGGGA